MKKILIAEDNETNFLLFCSILADIDIEILHARNGREAVNMCEPDSNIRLVLMDINMPIMSGEDAAVLIKIKCPEIPIVSQTAYDVYGTVNEENKKYFDDFITKPIDVPNLIRLVYKYCSDDYK